MGAAGNLCHYCGLAGHNINTCPAVEEDIGLGRIRRNKEGCIVLPGGGFVPRSMAGNNMRERVMNWHQNFPGHASVNTLTLDSPPAPQPMFYASEVGVAPSATMTTAERIQSLERELLALCPRSCYQ